MNPLWPLPELTLVLPAMTPFATELAALATKAVDAADHWMSLGNEDRALECHKIAAAYFSAAMAAQANSL